MSEHVDFQVLRNGICIFRNKSVIFLVNGPDYFPSYFVRLIEKATRNPDRISRPQYLNRDKSSVLPKTRYILKLNNKDCCFNIILQKELVESLGEKKLPTEEVCVCNLFSVKTLTSYLRQYPKLSTSSEYRFIRIELHGSPVCAHLTECRQISDMVGLRPVSVTFVRQQFMCTSCSVQSISPSEVEEYTRAEYADMIFEYGYRYRPHCTSYVICL
ncbi:hypothetical protein ANN_15818 [Periplaneta americana]|uniref:Uncharacterized protein n=1 Tax=Periplaneta americana TaxID=6978 RepID=A0ABQ8SH93_PERAM|nr:hypothetical protein ANN_15818 [Periplaneta americana]